MSAQRLIIGMTVVAGVGLGAGAIFLHRQNVQVRNRIIDLRQRAQPVEPLRQDNERLRVLSQKSSSGSAATGALHIEVEHVRAEVTELEKKAELRRAQLTAQAASDENALANNRDPNVGLTRLEYFRDVGRATPRAACETAVAAALKGDEPALKDMLFLSDAARAKAGELIASLADDSHSQWTPEKLAALYFTGVVTDVAAAQIVRENIDGPGHATLTLRVPGVDEAKSKLKLQQDAAGWRVIVPENYADVVRRKISATAK